MLFSRTASAANARFATARIIARGGGVAKQRCGLKCIQWMHIGLGATSKVQNEGAEW